MCLSDDVSMVAIDSGVLAILRLHLLRKEFNSIAKDIKAGKTQGDLDSRLGVEYWVEQAILQRLEREGAVVPHNLSVKQK